MTATGRAWAWLLTAGSVLALAAVWATLLTMSPARPVEPAQVVARGTTPLLSPGGASEGERRRHGPRVHAVQEQVRAALDARTWPRLEPSIDDVLSQRWVGKDLERCANLADSQDPDLERDCSWGSGERTVMLLGDSIAVSYAEPLSEVLLPQGWRVLLRAGIGCPFNAVPVRSRYLRIAEACPGFKEAVVEQVRLERPDLVLVVNRYGQRFDRTTGEQLEPAQWRDGLRAMLARVAPHTGRLAVLGPPPLGGTLRECYGPLSSPAACIARITPDWFATAAADAEAVRAVGGTYVDARPLYCDERGLCPSFVGQVPVKPDGIHLTRAYARAIAPALEEVLRQHGLP